MRSPTEIGFGKKVRLTWLNSALDHAAAGESFHAVQDLLGKEIAADNSGPEAIRKVQTSIKRVWFNPPQRCEGLRERALDFFRRDSSKDSRLILNWGMTIAAYPFVGTIAEILGRLLKLQKEVRRTDVDRRVREQLGDRDFIGRIARYDVSSFVDWGVITEAGKKGQYVAMKPIQFANMEQLAWLAEALIISRNKTQMTLSELMGHPTCFPVALDQLSATVLRSNTHLKVVRQGLNEEHVLLET